MLSESQIKQFQELYKKHFGREISQSEAIDQGEKLIRLMELVYRPMTAEEHKKYEPKP